MSEFLKFAYELLSQVLYNIVQWLAAFVKLLLTGWVEYFLIFRTYFPTLNIPAKILSVLLMLVLIAIPVLIIVMFYTGMCLWVPTMNLPFFAAGTNLVGGLMSMRIIHYFMMYIFIIFMFIHVYLANIEGIAPTKLMFLWKEHGGLVYDPDTHTIVGEDDLGESEKH